MPGHEHHPTAKAAGSPDDKFPRTSHAASAEAGVYSFRLLRDSAVFIERLGRLSQDSRRDHKPHTVTTQGCALVRGISKSVTPAQESPGPRVRCQNTRGPHSRERSQPSEKAVKEGQRRPPALREDPSAWSGGLGGSRGAGSYLVR